MAFNGMQCCMTYTDKVLGRHPLKINKRVQEVSPVMLLLSYGLRYDVRAPATGAAKYAVHSQTIYSIKNSDQTHH
jgi:hypothetical protein